MKICKLVLVYNASSVFWRAAVTSCTPLLDRQAVDQDFESVPEDTDESHNQRDDLLSSMQASKQDTMKSLCTIALVTTKSVHVLSCCHRKVYCHCITRICPHNHYVEVLLYQGSS